MKHVAIYVRVSSNSQDFKAQEPDLKRWAEAQEQPVKFYRDKVTGTKMERPGWDSLASAMQARKVSAIVVWRIDRLGRTAKGLTALFEDLQQKKVNLISLRDGLDLSTPAGRLMANVLASVAQYETEVRSERQRAGIAAARAAGKRWGGGMKGVRKKVTQEAEAAIRSMKAEGHSILGISKIVKLSRPTIYSILNLAKK